MALGLGFRFLVFMALGFIFLWLRVKGFGLWLRV